jgi:RNA polymerase sigma-70 factor, ECF subfamily
MDTISRTRDEWLALRCQAREPGAFEDLITVMERPLLYYASKLTGRDDRAPDVLQEVWMKAFRGIRKLKDPGRLRPWLYTMTHGIAVDRIRQSSSRERAEEAYAETWEEAAELTFAEEDAAALHRALDELEPRQREVLVLHFLEEFSLAEISEIIGCPEGTVKSRLHYAKKALRAVLLRGRHESER